MREDKFYFDILHLGPTFLIRKLCFLARNYESAHIEKKNKNLQLCLDKDSQVQPYFAVDSNSQATIYCFCSCFFNYFVEKFSNNLVLLLHSEIR